MRIRVLCARVQPCACLALSEICLWHVSTDKVAKDGEQEEVKVAMEEVKVAKDLTSPEQEEALQGLKSFYLDEDWGDAFDAFLYNALTTPKSRKWINTFMRDHGFPTAACAEMATLQWLIQVVLMTVLTLVQIGAPVLVIYEAFPIELNQDQTIYLKVIGTLIMFLTQIQLASDFLKVGAVYIAPRKLHMLPMRTWVFVWGMVVNFGSIFSTQVAVFFSLLITSSTQDFIMNFAALFVIYHLDDYLLSRNGKSELRHMLLDLKPGDLDLVQDERRASSGIFYLIRVSFLLLMAIQNILVLALPILFLVFY